MTDKPAKYDFSFIYFLSVCLLALVVISESLFIVGFLSQGRISQQPTIKEETGLLPTGPVGWRLEQYLGSMSIVLEEDQKVIVGKTLKARVVFNSPSAEIGGVDAILNFDPKLVEIRTITPNKEVFDYTPITRQQEGQGRIKITAYGAKTIPVGTTTLVLFDFRLLKSTQTVIGLEFKGSGEVKDSNLIAKVGLKDVLGRVVPLRLEPAPKVSTTR